MPAQVAFIDEEETCGGAAVRSPLPFCFVGGGPEDRTKVTSSPWYPTAPGVVLGLPLARLLSEHEQLSEC